MFLLQMASTILFLLQMAFGARLGLPNCYNGHMCKIKAALADVLTPLVMIITYYHDSWLLRLLPCLTSWLAERRDSIAEVMEGMTASRINYKQAIADHDKKVARMRARWVARVAWCLGTIQIWAIGLSTSWSRWLSFDKLSVHLTSSL